MGEVGALIAKALFTAVLIVALSEIGKRMPMVAGILIALPLGTLLTMGIMHYDGTPAETIRDFAWSVLLYLPPGVVFILVAWAGLAAGWSFWSAIISAIVATAGAFGLYAFVLSQFGVRLS